MFSAAAVLKYKQHNYLIYIISAPPSASAHHRRRTIDATEKQRRQTLYEEARTRAPFHDFFLWSEAHLVYNLDIEAVDLQTLRERHTNKIFREMLISNGFPASIRLHRKHFSTALIRADAEKWNMDDTYRRELVFDMFDNFNKNHSPIPHFKLEDDRILKEYLASAFKRVKYNLAHHRKICADGGRCRCFITKPGGIYKF